MASSPTPLASSLPNQLDVDVMLAACSGIQSINNFLSLLSIPNYSSDLGAEASSPSFGQTDARSHQQSMAALQAISHFRQVDSLLSNCLGHARFRQAPSRKNATVVPSSAAAIARNDALSVASRGILDAAAEENSPSVALRKDFLRQEKEIGRYPPRNGVDENGAYKISRGDTVGGFAADTEIIVTEKVSRSWTSHIDLNSSTTEDDYEDDWSWNQNETAPFIISNSQGDIEREAEREWEARANSPYFGYLDLNQEASVSPHGNVRAMAVDSSVTSIPGSQSLQNLASSNAMDEPTSLLPEPTSVVISDNSLSTMNKPDFLVHHPTSSNISNSGLPTVHHPCFSNCIRAPPLGSSVAPSNGFLPIIAHTAQSSAKGRRHAPHSDGPKSGRSPKCHCATKRRKSKNKIVKRVAAVSDKIAEIPADEYCWRKYGQKPIKGSPYPRGYYKCSGVKGCPARKHVERALDDPTMLIVTYEGEHDHAIYSR
ncbi:hypothetical protein KP509_07G043400 [Ceratopteris richardii]|uniref:WRKY domain-containing protein n=1 Tax=Ceratopteris richardii TaxID=49495 RepID=A0A8T2UDW3_CERRI|nr:hypothetical protein KP509_07G043400 [Ceratopteris richardii]